MDANDMHITIDWLRAGLLLQAHLRNGSTARPVYTAQGRLFGVVRQSQRGAADRWEFKALVTS